MRGLYGPLHPGRMEIPSSGKNHSNACVDRLTGTGSVERVISVLLVEVESLSLIGRRMYFNLEVVEKVERDTDTFSFL